MEEIEVKILEINKKEMIKKLKKLGAKKTFEGKIYAVSYDFKNGVLAKKNSFIRLRRVGNKSFLTYKRKITQRKAKIMKEIETEIDDFNEMRKILLAINLKPANDYTKKRTSYKLGKVTFEIDEYKQIPAYMEIEAPTIKQINKFIKKLSIDKSKIKTWTGKEVFKHYGIKTKFMRI
ncbi:class IV adenylate cyclase [Candidatus Woesearchaeota archaeon]|nr:class IV adenylate cyclase [Candidatus Woesearchaeota archaeon]